MERSKRSKGSQPSMHEPVRTGCIRPRLPIGNIACSRRYRRFSRHDGHNTRPPRRHSKPSYTNTSGNAKSSWTGCKKKRAWLPEGKRALSEPAHPHLSLARQCDLVGLPRSSFDYRPQGERGENLHLMRLLDAQYTLTPSDGVRRMTVWLRSEGSHVHHKRVARLRPTMGSEAISPKPRVRQPQPLHRVYPY